MIFLDSCPICSAAIFENFLDCKDYTTSGEIFSLKKCKNCGFTFTDPKPDELSIGKYYLSENYISHTGGKKNVIDAIYLLARKIALKQKRKIIQRYSKGNSILDFGCGTGEFLKEMKDNYWQVSGIETSPLANAKASQINQEKIEHDLSAFKEKSFDVITLWHVLEHVHDLNKKLKSFHSLLKESGTILIAVPNLESYDAKYYQKHWAGYDVPRHLWHFNQLNIKQLFDKNGFKLIKTKPMKMDSFYVSLLSETYQNPSQGKIMSFGKALMQGFISNLKARKNNNYSSLIYIAKR